MSDLGFALSPAPTSSVSGVELSDRRLRWMELGLVLLCTIATSILTSAIVLHRGTTIAGVSNERYAVMMLQQAGGLCLLSYVLSRNRRAFASIGLQPSLSGAGQGLLLYLATFVAAILFVAQWRLVASAMGTAPIAFRQMTGMVSTASPWVLFIFATLNPWFEELIVRGYLMTECMDLTGSAWVAIAASTIIQASYHLYQGWYNAGLIAVTFLIFSIYYAKTRNIFPVIIAHMLQDYFATWSLWHHLHR